MSTHGVVTLPETVALGTMHGKEAAIAPAFAKLGLSVVVPSQFATDRFGTFTGKVPRAGTVRVAARVKAHAAIAVTGLEVGLASEGAFGPHPTIPFVGAGLELMLWHDTRSGLEVVETLLDDQPCYDSVEATDAGEIDSFLTRVGFPETGLIVAAASTRRRPVAKGVRDAATLARAIATARRDSASGRAFVQTDMRAHMNARRMQTIATLAGRLAERFTKSCAACGAPGWGLLKTETGLPRGWCGRPSVLAGHEIQGCSARGATDRKPRADGLLKADPGYCPLCNP